MPCIVSFMRCESRRTFHRDARDICVCEWSNAGKTFTAGGFTHFLDDDKYVCIKQIWAAPPVLYR